ncbi:uncharacterized protein LOC131313056 [Rhododendron vialii]|uniref:uncharacterized protein LOC131313056 n=1 Tax=Rhododendron vialii TaxID=182163 RepID=UPI00265D69E2|nr:uncharacterized protein LOC131313056 [Rhododendron vialii]
MSHGFKQYTFTPPETIAIINSSDRLWYVKIEDGKLTEGWDKIVHAHNIQDNFTLLFGYVGHLQFDLYVLNTEGCEVKYQWSSALPIHQLNAPIAWDAEMAMHNSNDSVTLTAYSPRLFRVSNHSVRCAILLTYTDLQRLSLPQYFRALCDQPT